MGQNGGQAIYSASFAFQGGTIKGGSGTEGLQIGTKSSLSFNASTAVIDGAQAEDYGTGTSFTNNSTLTLKNGAKFS